MKFLCLIYLNEKKMDAMPARDMNALNARHLDFNDGLRASGHFIEDGRSATDPPTRRGGPTALIARAVGPGTVPT